ncbi:medium-chain acyl-CoA ligase ACSF2, mitochondrial [Prorops nasuta]|uniref:medium-chain acyl-CoA ligase ACSF2, mitochondrial n=1 Tax=Prorops nasuta TaxID=863751 RepID=UPI0034CF7964
MLRLVEQFCNHLTCLRNQKHKLKCFHALGSNVCARHSCTRNESRIEKQQGVTGANENLAYLKHSSEKPINDKTIGQLLQESVEKWPDRELIFSVHQNIRLTFSEVLRRADKLAGGLKKLGLKRGDHVGIWGPNDVEWLISAAAIARLGQVLIGINPAYQQSELEYCLNKVDVKAVISPAEFKTQNYPRMLLKAKESCPRLKHIIVYSDDHISGAHRFCDVECSASRVEIEAIGAEQSDISCRSSANVQFTSGTTGHPKATLLSHKSLVNNSRQVAHRAELGVGYNKICFNVPFFHAFGLLSGYLGSLHEGSSIVLESRSYNPVKSLEAISIEKCTVSFGTPTMWLNLLDAQQRMKLPTNLRVGQTGGSPASPEMFKRIVDLFGLSNMKSIYGLTECTGVAFQSLPGEDVTLAQTTVGHLSDHVEATVVNENGSPVQFGQVGELWIRGYINMLGYFDDETSTRKMIREDGWLQTGDQFILREDGYGHIVGRIKDMLIRGGENIFPKEIEDFLITHPKIKEVQVVGAYDKVLGEEICACIILQDGAKVSTDDLRKYCKGKIAHFKIPRYIHFVNEYPKTTSGKIQKNKLRQHLEEEGLIPRELSL